MQPVILTYPPQARSEAPMEGKFLQLNLAGRDCLLFAASTEYRYHNQVLARFLSERTIAYHWEGPENLLVNHPELAVRGGGRFRLDPTGETLRVWDESSVYGRFDASSLAAQLAAAGPPWDRLALRVG